MEKDIVYIENDINSLVSESVTSVIENFIQNNMKQYYANRYHIRKSKYTLYMQKDIDNCLQLLKDKTQPIHIHYNSIYQLRIKHNTDAMNALMIAFDYSTSDLIKHEIAFILGQIVDNSKIDSSLDLINIDVNNDINIKNDIVH